MNVKTYQALAMRTRCPQGDPIIERLGGHTTGDHNPSAKNTALLHGCIGLAGEVGELSEAIQSWQEQGIALDKVNLLEEAGDLTWHAAEICDALSISYAELLAKAGIYPGNLVDIHHQLCTTSGELMAMVQRWLFYGKGLDISKVPTYLIIVLECASAIARFSSSSINQVMEANIAKLRKRYPDKYSDTLAAEENRDRAAERQILEGKTKGVRVTVSDTTQFDKFNSRSEVCNPQFEQNGQGWAESPEDQERPTTLKEVEEDCTRPHTDHELKRKELISQTKRAQFTPSYPNLCKLCQEVTVHKSNKLRICPDCMDQLKAEVNKKASQNSPVTQAEKLV